MPVPAEGKPSNQPRRTGRSILTNLTATNPVKISAPTYGPAQERALLPYNPPATVGNAQAELDTRRWEVRELRVSRGPPMRARAPALAGRGALDGFGPARPTNNLQPWVWGWTTSAKWWI